MAVRILFALLALQALYGLGLFLASGLAPDPFLSCLLVTCLAMVVPWGRLRGRWTRWVSPGPNLGVLSKLLGWTGASGLPLVVASYAPQPWAPWIGALISVMLPTVAVALWKGYAWAAWTWYLAALASFAMAGANLVDVVSGEDSVLEHGYAIVAHVGDLTAILVWSLVGATLAREITTRRRMPARRRGLD